MKRYTSLFSINVGPLTSALENPVYTVTGVDGDVRRDIGSSKTGVRCFRVAKSIPYLLLEPPTIRSGVW
jgi:hypothetical protein